MVIQLNDYRIAKAAAAAADRRDGVQPRPDWNPAFAVIALAGNPPPRPLSPALPDDSAAVEPEFMNQVYALASQI